MQYFKREMLNREENYNEKFNSRPNIGVMEVVKGKDPSAGKGSKGAMGRKPSPMRMIPANNHNMMNTNSVGGLGVGNRK